MLTILYGKSGTGKTTLLFDEMEKAAGERPCYLLVPDREAVMAESRASALRNAGNIDVLTFSRLCNTLFRRYGGLASHYIGAGAKKLIMRGVMKTLSPLLHEYKSAEGLGIYEKMTAMRTVFYQDRIFSSDLDRASDMLPEGSPLRAKLSDLSLIFAAFDAELQSRWEDPDGMLSRGEALLAEHDFFHGSAVFVDSFTSFSPQQIEVLVHILRGADEVYITMPYLPEEREEASARFLAGADKKLRRAAERAGVGEIRTVTLRETKRYDSEALAFLAAEISAQSAVGARFENETEDILLVRAANAFAEAEAAALHISRAVRNGYRYREIAVIVRDPSSWKGILDAVFRKFRIPYFLSSRADIAEKTLVKLIVSAFSVIGRDFRTEDVISYLKSGFAGIDADDVSLFENYIIKWKLRGKLFTGDDPWMMHPRGYGFSFSEEDQSVLSRLAEMKETVISPLKVFSAANKTAKTVRERATLLFDFLSGLHVSEKLAAKAEEAEKRGERALAMETIQLWNALSGALDQLVTCAGESEVSVQEFSQMLMMLLRETDIGKIPTSVDEVLIAGAAETLAGERQMVLLLGANEGKFPLRVSEDGLFSEYEKKSLAALHVELSDRLEKRVSEELYFFYRAVSMAKKKLYISFSHYDLSGSEERESVGVKRVRKLFPKLSLKEHELSSPEELVEGKAASFEHAAVFRGNLGRALTEYYENDPVYGEKCRYMRLPLGAEETVLSPENAALLFPGTLKTSYTRLEKFIKCRFAYFCEYELRLRDDSPANFGALDIGSFMHSVLENCVRWIAGGGEGDVTTEVTRIASEYLATLFGRDPSELSGRLRHLFHYLIKCADIFSRRMKEEFAESKFRPCDFELTVGKDGDGVLPMQISSEGIDVELRGKIDRVDLYEGEGGKLYLRVVDYKTGAKTFDMKNIKLGLDMQMLLYLFSLWENGGRRYHGEVIPAGVIYAGIGPPQVDLGAGEVGSENDICVNTSGLFLAEETVLRAMDETLSGKWIPVREKDLKSDKARSNLVGLDAFMELKKEVTETVTRFASELKVGTAYAKPIKRGREGPCVYCRMRAVCRIK